MEAEPLVDLRRERDLAGNLRATLTLYGRFPLLFLALAFVVVLPVGLLVQGIVLGDSSDAWEGDDDAGDGVRVVLALLLPAVFTTPLVTAAHARAILEIGHGLTPGVWSTIAAVLPRLPVLVVTVLIADVCIVLGLAALVVPGIFLWVILQFASQVVAVEGLSVNRALVRSAHLARGEWWRIFGYLILLGIVAGAAAGIVTRGAEAVDDSAAMDIAASIVAETITLSISALVLSLLFFDLRVRHARREEAAGDPSEPEEPPPTGDSAG